MKRAKRLSRVIDCLHRAIAHSLPVLLLLAGCGGAPPVREPISPLYTALTDEFTAFDFGVLRGKKILIDPGHGGRFTGTTGQNGLEEKSVNLGVSLYLWGLLKEAGADAYLTRAADRDFLVEQAESDLTRDLAARVAISDSLDPDLFLSVHHNARGDTNRAFNQIEVYYPMADDGPSRDAAHAIFFHLKRNLGEAKGRVIPGNFYVLRENGAPAVLGESSYLSHPPVEEKLKLSDIQRLEAEAYFLGVTRYFMSGAPRAWFVTETDSLTEGDRFVPAAPRDTIRSVDAFHVQAIVRDEDGFAGIDPSTIELSLDGAPLAHRFLPGSDRVQAALPYDIANAGHELTLRARNLNGNSTKVARRDVLVDLPVDEGGTYGLRDRGGHFVLGFPDARGFPIRDQVLRMRGGDLEFPIQGGGVDVHFYDERLGTDPMYALVGIDTFAIRLDELPLYSGVSVVRPFEPLWAGDSIAAFADAFGLVGYDVAARRLFDRPDASPGAPHVVIDPDRRPSQSGPCARSSVSFVSKQTKALLDWYGPGAALSHSEREAPHPAVRVRAAGEYDARLWITFREADSYSVTHFPGSRLGGPAAKAIADKMTDRLGVTVPVRTDTEPVLRDTPCPALVVRFPQEEDCDISASTRLHALAQAVSEGVALAGTRNGSEFWESIHFKEYRLPDLEAGDLVYFELAGITLQVREKGDFLLLAPRPPEIIGSARIRSAGKWFSYREKYEGTAPEPRLEP